MKILHLLSSTSYSGAENVVCQIIDMFTKETCEMCYCSPFGLIDKTLKEKSIKYLPLKKLKQKYVKRVIKEYKPDIIHAHDVKASIIASNFSKKVKIISHIHGNDERKMGKLTLKSFLYNFVSNKFDKIVWVSNSSLDNYYFKNKVKDKSLILHNIININNLIKKSSLDSNNYDYDIIYLGRLSEIKNPLRSLQILKEVVKYKPELKCAFIGNGPLIETCKKFVEDNKLNNNIEFLGFISNPYKILSNSRLVLMSSINEGTPMVLLESFALGIPLISTKIDGAVELLKNEHMGELYETNEEATTKILKVLNNDRSYYKDYLVNFSINFNNVDKYKEKLMNIYIKVKKNKPI